MELCLQPLRAVKDKANHAVVLDKSTSDKLQKDVQSYRLITVAVLVDRLKINGSLARQALNDLEEKGLIKPVVKHSKLQIYSEWSSTRGSVLGADASCSESNWRWGLNGLTVRRREKI